MMTSNQQMAELFYQMGILLENKDMRLLVWLMTSVLLRERAIIARVNQMVKYWQMLLVASGC